MIEKCRLAANEIAGLEALNGKTVAEAVANFENLNVTRLVIADQDGKSIYDSLEIVSSSDKIVLFPEIVVAL